LATCFIIVYTILSCYIMNLITRSFAKITSALVLLGILQINSQIVAQHTSFPYYQSFETGLGSWTQDTDEDFDWTARTGGTPSNNTGPSEAADGATYIYLESSDPNSPSKVATITSGAFDLSKLTTPKFSFAYHMYGANMGTLDLQISTDDGANWASLWQKSGDQTNNWITATIDLAAYQSNQVKFRFVGTTGDSFRSDAAVDRIQINDIGALAVTSISPTIATGGSTITLKGQGFSAVPSDHTVKINGVQIPVVSATTTELKVILPASVTTDRLSVEVNSLQASSGVEVIIPLTVYPYAESFEDGLGMWMQDPADDFDWRLRSGATPTSSTGPSGAIDGSIYLYVESSDPNYPTKTGIITSRYFDLTSLTNPKLEFIYHMYGSSMGTLKVEASTDGKNWNTLLTRSGDKGDTWFVTSADLSAYKTTATVLRFVATTASSFRSDIAIDRIKITGDDVLTLSGFSPAQATENATVTIAGANFSTTASSNIVKFNGTAATVTSASANQLTVLVPSGASNGKITVETGGNTVTSNTDFTMVYPPTIASFSPQSAKAGNTVTITGTNFDAIRTNNTIKFNGEVAVINSASNTELQVYVPNLATTGKITLEVNGFSQTTATDFTIIPSPVMTDFSPKSGKEGSTVTITGKNFDTTPGNNLVKFNGTAATVTAATTTELQVTVPAGILDGNITVEVAGDVTTSSEQFTVILPPTITSFSPNSGKIGSTIIITGTGFDATATKNTVKINGVPTTVSFSTNTELTIVVPNDATTGKIYLEVNGFNVTTTDDFTVILAPSVPTISDFSPKSGVKGDVITITGTNFSTIAANNIVKFNGVTASLVDATSTELKVAVPGGSVTGKISVEVNGSVVTSADDFTAILPIAINDFSPKSGQTGDTVTITGVNFGETLLDNLVTFNGTSAAIIVANNSQLQVIVPEGVSTGKISITAREETVLTTEDFTVKTVASLPNQLRKGKLSLYPNPTRDVLYISLQNKATPRVKVHLYNLQGQAVWHETLTIKNGLAKLNLAQITAGEYVLAIEVGNQVISRRVMKK
jgi:ribosomal protein L18E